MAGESTVGKRARSALDSSRGLGRRFCNDTRGAVFVEFIISFVPMFIFFLGIMQLAFSYAAKLVVHHAATKAARAAIVTEPLPKRNCQGGDPTASDRPREFPPGANAMPDPFNQQAEATAGDAAQGSPLQIRVRAAAYLPLATLAPPTFAYPLGANVLQAVAGFAGQYVSRFASQQSNRARGGAGTDDALMPLGIFLAPGAGTNG